MTGRPLIGVTTSEVRYADKIEPTLHGEPRSREMALGLKYLQAIEEAGGLPVVLPPLDLGAIDDLLPRLCGICLSGGPDLDPVAYGASPHAELGPTYRELDRFELELARRADWRGMPILAICRGMQALNVARGGTLIQHLPEQSDGEVEHRQAGPGDQTTHEVDVRPNTKLHALLGAETCPVNSFHHQAIDHLGRGLQVVARASDGVIEGIEDPIRPFLVGVQWHAETLTHLPEQYALFGGLVEASRSATSRRLAA
jgi:putative glutamine amidotransferase